MTDNHVEQENPIVPTSNTTNEETPRSAFEEFLFHQRRALEETGKALEALLPEGFRVHSQEATKEFTKGFRVLVDAAMEEIKKATEKAQTTTNNDDEGPSTTGRTKVKVTVE